MSRTESIIPPRGSVWICVKKFISLHKTKSMQRFFNKIEKSKDGCWLWKAGSRGNGYGAFKFNRKTIDAHRISWMLHYGDIPDGMFICHKCDVRQCVNPEHLFLGTNSDNMKDCYRKNRMTLPKGGGFKDGNTPKNKIYSDKFVLLIIDAIRNKGKMSLIDISNLYNVSYQFIRDLNSKRIYKRLV